MEDIQNFISDNSELGTYFRIKKEYPLLYDELICALAFEHLHNEEYFNQVKEQRNKENEMLKAQMENNINKIIENGIEQYTPKDIILNKIDYSINEEITELLESFSNLNVNVSDKYESQIKTVES